MKFQACDRCGAQFDVSSFAPGQKFRCGSCDAVLTAHVAPRPAPPAPAAPASGRAPGSRRPGASPSGAPAQPRSAGRAPAARAPGGPAKVPGSRSPRGAVRTSADATVGRGPQYRPPSRQAEGAAKPQRPKRAAREERRRPSAAERKPGPNPALIYGIGGLLVAAVLLFLLFGSGGKEPTQTSTSTNASTASSGGGPEGTSPTTAPTPSADTLASLKSEMSKASLKTAADYRGFAERFLALKTEEATQEARDLYQELIRQVDPNDLAARKFLGYTDFQSDVLGRKLEEWEEPIPETIANRKGYPFLDAVVDFNARRWLDDEDDIQLAREAVEKMREHERKLRDDHIYRAGDQIRANIATDPLLGDLNYETIWAAPYLICYSSNEALSEFDLRKEPDKKKRKEAREKLAEKRKAYEAVLEEKAAIFTSTYNEWMRRFAEPFDLKPLTDEYGGRPDYKPGVRSYPDGVPLVIWIFTDQEAFQKFHEERKGGRLPPGVAGYFTPSTGWIFLFDEVSQDTQARVFEINKTVHEATHQLEYWFTRQKSKWGMPKPTQDSFSEGIAEFLGAVQMQPDFSLKFIEVNVPRLGELKQTKEALKRMGRDEYPIFPVENLIAFESYQEMTQWCDSTWKLGNAAMSLFYQQSWAFTYFVNHFQNGKYKDSWLQYFDGVLDRQTGLGNNKPVFMRVFKIRDEEEWDDIQADWEKYMKEVVIPMSEDVSKWKYDPPARKK